MPNQRLEVLKDKVVALLVQNAQLKSTIAELLAKPDTGEEVLAELEGLFAVTKPIEQIAPTGSVAATISPTKNVLLDFDISKFPVHPNSDQFVANIGAGTALHPDFGASWEGKKIGIPITYGTSETIPKVELTFTYKDESDAGPYPIGTIEDGSDRHSIVVLTDERKVYELFNVDVVTKTADSGAIYNLDDPKMRTFGFTSADAAGLPVYHGLVQYDEAASGEIRHALRFTAEKTHGSTWPGSHSTRGIAGTVYEDQPPLGAIFRLKADFDITPYSPINQALLKAMKTYGLRLADNGSNWFISGAHDARWDNDDWLY